MRSALFVLCLSMLSACGHPTDGPGAAAHNFLQASVTRDAQTLNTLLPQSTKAQLNELHQALKQIRSLISEHYQDETAKEALKASGADILDIADTPGRLFDSLILRSGTPEQLSTSQEWSLRIRSTVIDGETAQVTTWGGNLVRLVLEAKQWQVLLNGDDTARLSSLVTHANGQLLEFKKMATLNNAQRYGVKKQ